MNMFIHLVCANLWATIEQHELARPACSSHLAPSTALHISKLGSKMDVADVSPKSSSHLQHAMQCMQQMTGWPLVINWHANTTMTFEGL